MFNWLNKNRGQQPAPENGQKPVKPQGKPVDGRPGDLKPQGPGPNMRQQRPGGVPGPQQSGQQQQRPRPQPQPLKPPPRSISGVTLYFTDEIIRCVKPDGSVEMVRWDGLAGVMILVSSEDRYSTDMKWVLAGRDQGGCVFPNTAAGASELIRYMQDHLKGFNNAEVIRAMECRETQKFLIWTPPKNV